MNHSINIQLLFSNSGIGFFKNESSIIYLKYWAADLPCTLVLQHLIKHLNRHGCTAFHKLSHRRIIFLELNQWGCWEFLSYQCGCPLDHHLADIRVAAVCPPLRQEYQTTVPMDTHQQPLFKLMNHVSMPQSQPKHQIWQQVFVQFSPEYWWWTLAASSS